VATSPSLGEKDELYGSIQSRSATKYYDPAATLSDDQIRELVRIGITALTSFHLQNWRFLEVRSL
jgi:nitroreductase